MRLLAALLVLAPLALAEEWALDLPLSELRMDGKVTEGLHGLGEVFPYVDVARKPLNVKTLRNHLRGKIDSEKKAIEAVRLFVAGPLVKDEAVAKKMVATGKALQAKLKHLRVKLHEHRPPDYAPAARKTKEGWRVSLVAFEMDRVLRLVHVEATVGVDGALKIERKPIVDGPMTSWQTAMLSTMTPEQQEAAVQREKAMRAEAVVARRTFAKALAPPCNLANAWVVARLRLSAAQMEDLWGKHDRIIGSGVYLVARDLTDGGAVIYDAGDKNRRVLRMSHVREAPRPMRVGPTLHVLSSG